MGKDALMEQGSRELKHLREMFYQASGIQLAREKSVMLKARLGKRMRALGFESYGQYYRHVLEDPSGKEMDRMVDCLTTNKTGFFRDPTHFEHFRSTAVRAFLDRAERLEGEPMRVWSAACSSGEEAYSLGMTGLEGLQGRAPLKVLGTDLSEAMVHRALEGWYDNGKASPVPKSWLKKYFSPEEREGQWGFLVGSLLRTTVFFAQMNLNGTDYPFRNPFDAIFCRNVMIYFEKPVQEILVGRLVRVLRTGGFLYTGSSESLIGIKHSLRMLAPSIYEKI